MNEPIISPWLFYWLEVLENINNAMLGILVTVVFVFIIAPIICIDDDGRELVRKVTQSKFLRNIVLAVAVISAIGLMFIPTKETALRMVVASYATPQNIEFITEKTGKAIDGGIDYMIDKIVEAADKWETRKGD